MIAQVTAKMPGSFWDTLQIVFTIEEGTVISVVARSTCILQTFIEKLHVSLFTVIRYKEQFCWFLELSGDSSLPISAMQ